jgi:hypothetical protein
MLCVRPYRGGLFAPDGCKLPSNASKEWSGTIEGLKKKREDAEKLAGEIIAQHIELDQEGKERSGLNETAASLVYDKEYEERHLERLRKKLTYIWTHF